MLQRSFSLKLTAHHSDGYGAIGHFQTNKIWWKVYHYIDPRYATQASTYSISRIIAQLWILGDGIGAEVAESVKTVFKADNVPIQWEQIDVSGVESGDKHSEELFRESIASLRRNKLGLKGMGLLKLFTQC